MVDAASTLLRERTRAGTGLPAGGPRLRVAVHDYGGYAFPVQLSRWLAAQGHAVLHLYSGDVEAPRGRLDRHPDDPASFAVEAVSTGRPLTKYDLARRWWQETRFGARLAERVLAFAPDVVLSANTPPAVQQRLLKALSRVGVPLVCWVQDIFSIGAAEILKGKPALLRVPALGFLERVEYGTLRAAAGLVVISPDFLTTLAERGVRHPRGTVIENWAPLGEIRPLPKDNGWARAQGLADRFVFLCSGTLGMKHDPGQLLRLAHAFRDDPAVRVVAVSQGLGRRFLEEAKARDGLDNLVLLDFQPFGMLPEVLATADVSVVLLEEYAGALSVPSKVYSHACAERPILAAIPAANLARRIVEREGLGLAVDPGDRDGFLAAARRLRRDADLRTACAAAQSRFAAHACDIARIGPNFLEVLHAARSG
ncbi:glycosyltransferase family 4 protein [Azospirillum sp. RWY-5-1]|uniref:Glycosyltransferase family 4 protein n=1 Tax=Azospirillum oleiclasticum TaxID=2735135 RepID=A0ABX2TAD3_9PROT|nr:glycosyltransferase family 4 protein [Azospirillum oleiclasticum]NYZ15283.1 glycosyltransferase family 4 protein [Azospirillum oleiclasticum]NYZ21296.1 glycosyltransferase family 4 protein [Azospirillum oleiclasticum]